MRSHFSAVYLLDSTCFDCAESLQDLFPFCGGDGSAANVKVLLRYELIAGALEPLQIVAAKRSDPGLALGAAERLSKKQQQISDKGFYDGKAWRGRLAKGSFPAHASAPLRLRSPVHSGR